MFLGKSTGVWSRTLNISGSAGQQSGAILSAALGHTVVAADAFILAPSQ